MALGGWGGFFIEELRPSTCGEAEPGRGGIAIGFLFLRWQELKREETKMRGIAKTPPNS